MRKFNNISSRNKLPTRFRGINDNPEENSVLGPKENIFGTFFKDRIVVVFSLAWFLPLIFITVYMFFRISALPSEVPLFYSRVWGEGQLASKSFLYLPVAGAFALGFVNLFISFILKNQDKLFTYLLLATGSMLSILATITVFNIINLTL